MNDTSTSDVLPEPSGQPRRLAFLGTPAMAVPPLKALVDGGFDVPIVVTRPPARRGRRGAPTPSPVADAAVELGCEVVHDPSALLGRDDLDLGVVVAYGALIRRPILAHLPMVNLHFSLLPRWRGAAPVERSLMSGDSETGVCVMTVAEGLDEGGIHSRRIVPIGQRLTASELAGQLVEVGTELLVDTLSAGLSTPEPQVGEVTYARKLTTAEMEIDWSQPADVIDRLIRVGRAWTTLGGRRVKIHEAAPRPDAGDVSASRPAGSLDGLAVSTGRGLIELGRVQPSGKSSMPADAWVRGLGEGTHVFERIGEVPNAPDGHSGEVDGHSGEVGRTDASSRSIVPAAEPARPGGGPIGRSGDDDDV